MLERENERLHGVTVHQMHALHDRPMMHGAFGDRLRHVSYFLSHVTRPCFHQGHVDLVPNHFSEVYEIISSRAKHPYVIASVAPPTARQLLARRVGRLRRQLHRAGALLRRGQPADAAHDGPQPHPRVADRRLGRGRLPARVGQPAVPTEVDRRIGGFVAERVRNGSTIQAGIGAIPNAVLAHLSASSRPRRAHRADLRRPDRPHRERCGERRPQGQQPAEGDRHVRPRHAAPVRLHPREPHHRAVVGQVRERPAHHLARPRLRVDQRQPGGRLPRPVRQRDDPRACTTRRRAGRATSLAARRTATVGRASSCCRPPPRTAS